MAVQSPPRRDADDASATGVYCYGVVSARDARPQPRGLGDAPVDPVMHDGVAALASRVPAGTVRARRRDLLSHMDVLGAAFEHGTVLPLRFGTVFENEGSLVDEFLYPRHDELAALLRDLSGQGELRVTSHYREDALLAEVVRNNRRIAQLREATRGAGAGHPALIELGELVAAEVQARTARDSRALLERLRKHALQYEVGEEPVQYELLRASFLVERKRVAKFEAELERFAADQAGRADVKLTGPLPPHSFVSLTHGGR
jgi:Gas vesicle synthesis protein GvpL/GvpF